MSDIPRMQWERYLSLWGVIVIFLFVVYVKKFKRIELYNYFLKCIYLFGYVSKEKSRRKCASVWIFKRWMIYRKILWYRASEIKSRKSSCDNCKIINKQIFEFPKKLTLCRLTYGSNMKNTLAVGSRTIIVLFCSFGTMNVLW